VSRALAYVLKWFEDKDRERALAYERTRAGQAALSLADAYAAALARLKKGPSITVGRLGTDGSLIDVAEGLARRHAMIVGSTGSGKSRFVLGFLLDQIKRALAAPSSDRTLGVLGEILDLKGETAVLLQRYLAAVWLTGTDEQREILANAVYTIDWTREYITPTAPYDNRAQIVSDPYQATLLTDVMINASKETWTASLKHLLYMWSWLLIDLRFPANFAFAERFFRDEAYRQRILTKVSSTDVRQYFAAADAVIARQTQEAFLRRLHVELSYPENRYAVGVPPDRCEQLLRSDKAELVIGNFGCTNVMPPSIGEARATWRAIGVLLDAPRRRERTHKTIVFEELATLVKSSPELLEMIGTGLRTLRSARVELVMASQDLASALPKMVVRNILLNTGWSATFRSREDEAEWVYPHVLFDPADRRRPSDRHRDFERDLESMPPRAFWFHAKSGGFPALPARSLDLPDPSDVAGGRPDEELSEVYLREIGRRSMLSTADAARFIAEWEATVVHREEIRPAARKKRAPANNLSDLLKALSNDGEEAGGADGNE
jgi:hypothetical protein